MKAFDIIWGLNHRNEAGCGNAGWRHARTLEEKDNGHDLQFLGVLRSWGSSALLVRIVAMLNAQATKDLL